MIYSEKTPFYREDDNEFLGFLVKDSTGWQAQTIFGHPIARAESRHATEAVLLERGLGFLMGVWQYFDTDDQDWFPCILKEVFEKRVTVIRTNAMGYQDPDDYKLVIINEPTESTLVKVS